MRAGVLGRVSGTFRVIDSYWQTREADGHELGDCLDVTKVFSLPDGGTGFAGEAARQRLATRTDREPTPEGVVTHETARPVTDYTEFAGVPGEFVVAGSGRGTFAFDFVASEADTDVVIERATLDLDALLTSLPDPTPWKLGFAGETSTGVMYGEDLRGDGAVEDLLARGTPTQVGVTYEADGERYKLSATRSGYVELYRPSDVETPAFLSFLRETVVPHVG